MVLGAYSALFSANSSTGSAGHAGVSNEIALFDDGGTLKLAYWDDTGFRPFASLSDVTAHPNLTGLTGTDNHTQYHNDARHTAWHDIAANNNAMAISGGVAGSATLGAHLAETSVHFLRQAQWLSVATGGTGEYTDIESALVVANASASSAVPYAIAIYPGTYDETNLTVNDYVSLISVVPRQAKISTVGGVSPLFKLQGNNYLSGLWLQTSVAGKVLELKGAGTGLVQIDNCYMESATGVNLDFNNTNQSVTIYNGCEFNGEAALISGKTSSSRLIARDSEFNFSAVNAVVSIIDINVSGSVTDLFDSCQFFADSITGGTTPAAFMDFDGSDLQLRNCYFRMNSGAGQTFSAVFAQSGNVKVQACNFEWNATSGTPYDFNAAAGATIQYAATVYDTDKTTGAGAITPLSIGAVQANDLDLNGQVTLTGTVADQLRILPTDVSGDGGDVISLVPQDTLELNGAFRGFFMDLTNLSPANTGASIEALTIDASSISQANDPVIEPLKITMPGAYTSTESMYAAQFTGDGRTVTLNTGTHAIDADSISRSITDNEENWEMIRVDAAINATRNQVKYAHHSTGTPVQGFGMKFRYELGEESPGPRTVIASKSVIQGTDATSGEIIWTTHKTGAATDWWKLSEDGFGGFGGQMTPLSSVHILGPASDVGGLILESETGVAERARFYPIGSSSAAIQIKPNGGALLIYGDTAQTLWTFNETQNESNIDLSVKADLFFDGAGSGLFYGEMCGESLGTSVTLAAQDTWYQVTTFDTNCPSNGTTPDHTNDHITISKAGDYHVAVSVSGGASISGRQFHFHIKTNNGAVDHVAAAMHVTADVGGNVENGAATGIATFAASDTAELWIQRLNGGAASTDFDFEDVSLTLLMVGGA